MTSVGSLFQFMNRSAGNSDVAVSDHNSISHSTRWKSLSTLPSSVKVEAMNGAR